MVWLRTLAERVSRKITTVKEKTEHSNKGTRFGERALMKIKYDIYKHNNIIDINVVT